jgi:hypothetical protein
VKSVNHSVFGLWVVDADILSKSVACSESITQRNVKNKLAHKLINNVFDSVGPRGRQMIATESFVYNEGELTSGVDIHLNPIKKEKKKSDGSSTTNRAKGRCRVFQVK